MRQLFLAMLAPYILHATTMTFSSCTAGARTETPCPGNLALSTGISGANYFVSAFAQGLDSGQGNISVLSEATAYYSPCPGCPPEPSLSAMAQAVVNDTYYTSGPARAGLVQLDVTIYSLHGNPLTGALISDGPYKYTDCPPGSRFGVEGCSGSALLPFQLGTDFQVYAAAPSLPIAISLSPGQRGAGAQDSVTVAFGLFESDGTTPVSFFAVPEPSTFCVLLPGLAACQVWRVRLSSKRPERSALRARA